MANPNQIEDSAAQRQDNRAAPPKIAVDEAEPEHDSPPGEMQDEPAIKDRDRDGALQRPSSGKSADYFKGDQS